MDSSDLAITLADNLTTAAFGAILRPGSRFATREAQRVRSETWLQKLTPKIVALWLLDATGPERVAEPVSGSTRLMKMAFLFEEEIYKPAKGTKGSSALLAFYPYDYGPFSEKMATALYELNALHMISELPVQPEDPDDAYDGDSIALISTDALTEDAWQSKEHRYSIEDLGSAYLRERYYRCVPQNVSAAVEALKTRTLSVPLHRLLEYVYAKYPDSASKSKIRRRILGADGV